MLRAQPVKYQHIQLQAQLPGLITSVTIFGGFFTGLIALPVIGSKP